MHFLCTLQKEAKNKQKTTTNWRRKNVLFKIKNYFSHFLRFIFLVCYIQYIIKPLTQYVFLIINFNYKIFQLQYPLLYYHFNAHLNSKFFYFFFLNVQYASCSILKKKKERKKNKIPRKLSRYWSFRHNKCYFTLSVS